MLGAINLARSLYLNSTLRGLDLQGNFITDPGATGLAAPLSFNSTLRGLNLENNFITDTGVIGFATSLISNSTLRCLGLDLNRQISDLSITAFWRTFVTNCTLTSLNLFFLLLEDNPFNGLCKRNSSNAYLRSVTLYHLLLPLLKAVESSR